MTRHFASDNNATVHPEIMAAIQAANVGHATAYGADPWTSRAEQSFKRHFGDQAEALLVFNGTGANVVSLCAAMHAYQAVICSAVAHLHVDECGALERLVGGKVLVVADVDGKLSPDAVRPFLDWRGDVHRSQPRVLSITNATELGTVYRPDEIRALAEWAHGHGMLLHLDGARLCNAAASLDLPLRAITTDCGVDVVSFGGTKNGLMMGEAVVLLAPELLPHAPFVRKQSMQLSSKMRFIAAQFLALLEENLWLRNARHANTMAALLHMLVKDIPGVEVTRPVEANAVFARIPKAAVELLQQHYHFYVWDYATTEVRWMCAHDTTEEDVRAFAEAIANEVGRQVVV